MDDLRYILNMPIEIKGIGRLYPFTMEDYALYSHYFNILTVTVNLYLQYIDPKEKELRKELESKIKNFDVVCSQREFVDMLLSLLTISFKTENLRYDDRIQTIFINDGKITRDNYDYIRNEIIKINNIRLPKQAKTKELQEWFDKAYKAKNMQNKNAGDMEDIITSIMAFVGYTPEEIKKMTVYQINKLIARLNKISEYKANIQFLCAGAEKIKLEHWSNKIEDKDDISVDYNDFVSTMKSFEKL
jgi:hypothetical protein